MLLMKYVPITTFRFDDDGARRGDRTSRVPNSDRRCSKDACTDALCVKNIADALLVEDSHCLDVIKNRPLLD